MYCCMWSRIRRLESCGLFIFKVGHKWVLFATTALKHERRQNSIQSTRATVSAAIATYHCGQALPSKKRFSAAHHNTNMTPPPRPQWPHMFHQSPPIPFPSLRPLSILSPSSSTAPKLHPSYSSFNPHRNLVTKQTSPARKYPQQRNRSLHNATTRKRHPPPMIPQLAKSKEYNKPRPVTKSAQ